MSYQPTYTITSSIVSHVADISGRMGYLSALESEARTLYLRRINRIRTIQGSLAIEGNALSQEQIRPQKAVSDCQTPKSPLKSPPKSSDCWIRWLAIYPEINYNSPLACTIANHSESSILPRRWRPDLLK